eukprot:m.170427 g.170427  ORF g.170427 m.170427 type:complete len:51 (+) comp14530_c3_seq1:330-482(+)
MCKQQGGYKNQMQSVSTPTQPSNDTLNLNQATAAKAPKSAVLCMHYCCAR